MPDAESGTDGFNIALGSLLNLSAGLEMQVGNYRAAAENARRAFQVFAMGDSARAQVTALTNLVSILTVSVEIKEAHRYADEADSRIGKLAELNRVRGNFLRETLFLGAEFPDEAPGWAAAARGGIYSYDFRIANLECLLQKIAYVKADYPNSLERGERCVSMLTKGAPGKLDNLSDSIYYSFKAKMMTGQKPFQAIIFEQLRGDDTPPLVKTRLELAQRFVEASIDISKGREARGRDHLSKLVSAAVSWEYDSGGLYDLTSDIIGHLEKYPPMV